MAWIVVIVGCITTYCAEIYWQENFVSYTECNDTLPMIDAELVNHRVVVKDIECVIHDKSE